MSDITLINSIMYRILSLLAGLIITLTIVLLTADVLIAQPPSLPGNPDQAPIDGGLGLLMAAGGAYAWKKLRKPSAK